MATFTERIQFVVEAVTGNAQKNLKGLRNEVAQAEGITGKAKAGFKNLGTTISSNMGLGLAAAGTAVAAFASKAVSDFSAAANEARQVSAATGLAVEEASRYLSTMRKMGVELSGGDLADVVLNINQQADAVKELGINATDSEGRLTGLIDHIAGIADETERAKLASKFFGEEGSRQFGVLIASGGEYKQVMADLSDGEVIDAEEAKKAKEFDRTMKDLSATLKDLSQGVAEQLVPVLGDLAKAAGFVADNYDKFRGNTRDLREENKSFWESVRDELTKTLPELLQFPLEESARRMDAAFTSEKEALQELSEAYLEHETAELGAERAAKRLEDQAKRTADALERKWTQAEKDAVRATDDFIDAQDRQVGAYDRVARAIQRHFDEQEAMLDWLERHRRATEKSAKAEDDFARSIRDRTQATLDGTLGMLDLADAQQSANDAFERWKKEHHEAVFAAELELDPAQEAQEADQALRDAAREALRLAEIVASSGKTAQEQAGLAADTLRQIIAQNPWLAPLLGGTLAGLTATATATPAPAAPVPTAFGGGLAGLKGQINVTINNPPGTDGRQVARGFEEWTRVNGSANTSGLPI